MVIGLPLDLNFVNVDIDDYGSFQDGSFSVEKLEYYENNNVHGPSRALIHIIIRYRCSS